MRNHYVLRTCEGPLRQEQLHALLERMPLTCWLMPIGQHVRRGVLENDHDRVKPVLVEHRGNRISILPLPIWRITCAEFEPAIGNRLRPQAAFCEAEQGSVLCTFGLNAQDFGVDDRHDLTLELYKYHTGESPHTQ
jgi:hypothetical protein